MKYATFGLITLVFCATIAFSAERPPRDIFADTWVGTDALGRPMLDEQLVGLVKHDQRRVAGIFYIAGHTDDKHRAAVPYTSDVTKILAAHPEARLDAKNPNWKTVDYHWAEPELGYFLSKDTYVIEHDMSMLADAGVDVVILDVTNAVQYWDQWETIFSTLEKMKAKGNKVPQICFWAFNGPVVEVVQNIYDRMYQPGRFRDLWFEWDGKPLLLCNMNPASAYGVLPAGTPPPAYSRQVTDFFTLRNMWWGYYEWGGKRYIGKEDNWSFGYDLGDTRVAALKPTELLSTHHSQREEAAVTPAQHASSLIGKSWTREHGEPQLDQYDLPKPTLVPWLNKSVSDPQAHGIYFQQRWDEAIEANPQFLYINDWNEWVAGKFPTDAGTTTPFMRRDSNFFLVDQYNAEFNRCIGPMKNGYTDNYYMQMAENLRRYKGARPIPQSQGEHTVPLNGDFKPWDAIDIEYRDTIGDTTHRDYDGYGDQHYQNTLGRNDIVTSKVAVDANNVYFYCETNDNLTPHTDKNWMLLLIDADKNSNTGWFGYDFLINQKITDDKTTTLMRYDAASPDHPWKQVATLDYRYHGKSLEIAVPRKLLGFTQDSCTFDFKWCDNPADLKDPISLCLAGDTAPNRRFNYRFIWRK